MCEQKGIPLPPDEHVEEEQDVNTPVQTPPKRKRIKSYKRKKPGGKYRTVAVKSHLRKRRRKDG